MLICGSTAIKHWMELLDLDFWRPCKDIDYLCTFKELPEHLKPFYSINNFIIQDSLSGKEYIVIDDCPVLEKIYSANKHPRFLELKYSCLLKDSHKYFYLGNYKKSFKHLLDYSNLYQYFSNIFKDEEFKKDSLSYSSYLITNLYNNDSRLLDFPSLDKTKQEFFNDKVNYYYDHDYIHTLVAIDGSPGYLRCLEGEVKFSNKLFLDLSYDDKIKLVLEEAYVLAIERCLIPPLKGDNHFPTCIPHQAFKYALTRIATNITSGVFREFTANNFSILFEKHNPNYYVTPISILLKS